MRRAHAHPVLLVCVLAFAGMCASFMQTILIPIQSELPRLLDASREDTAWVITVTPLVSAICTPVSGRLGDMYGKRRVAIVLLSMQVAGSAVCALAPGVALLIVGRGLQGAGLGVIPLGIAMLRDLLPAHRLSTAIAIVSATLGVGGALGLPLSAFVTERWDWHILFVAAGTLSALALTSVAVVVPEGRRGSGGRFDLVGALGLGAGLVGVLVAISRGNEWGWGSPATLTLLIGGVLVLLAWGWYELRRSSPLVDLRVSASRPVLMTNLASISMGFALFASSVTLPQLLELPEVVGGLGLPLLDASLVLMPAGLAMLGVSTVAGRIERVIGPKALLVCAAVVLAAGYATALIVDLQVWTVLLVNVAIGIGVGLGFAAMPALIMAAVPVDETAAANGLNALMRALGTTCASAVVAAVLASNSTIIAGVSAPAPESFQWALFTGLIASIACVSLASFIPRGRSRTVGLF